MTIALAVLALITVAFMVRTVHHARDRIGPATRWTAVTVGVLCALTSLAAIAIEPTAS